MPLLPGQSRESVRDGEVVVEYVALVTEVGVTEILVTGVALAGVIPPVATLIDVEMGVDAEIEAELGLEAWFFLLSIPPKAPPTEIPIARMVARIMSSQK